MTTQEQVTEMLDTISAGAAAADYVTDEARLLHEIRAILAVILRSMPLWNGTDDER